MSNQNRVSTYNGLPKTEEYGLRIVALEANLAQLSAKLNTIAQMLSMMSQATKQNFQTEHHNHQILVQTIVEKNIVTMDDLKKKHQELLLEMQEAQERAQREAAEQKENKDSNAGDTNTKSSDETGSGNQQTERVSGEPRRHLSEVPRPERERRDSGE